MSRQPASRGSMFRALPASQRGVTLIELMVALVLGLIVTGAALALFVTNRQTYAASESLGRVQEATRAAFELMTRDLREADSNPCSNEIRVTNELKDFTSYAWWSDWGDGLNGYTGAQALPDVAFGTTAGTRVAGTPAIELWTAQPTGILVKDDSMTLTDQDLPVTSTAGKNVNAGDILMVCDYGSGAIFQASGVGADTIKHAVGGTPGNASGNLPTVYGSNAAISRLRAVRWYVAYTDRTDQDGNLVRSLFRTSLSGADKVQTPDEIVEGVSDLVLEYHTRSAGTYTTSPPDWSDVDAVRISLTLEGDEKLGTDGQALSRTFNNVVTLRSRAL